MDMFRAAEHVSRAVIDRASSRAPIAITGIGCRFPGNADSPDMFWHLLCLGRDAIREVPEDRWDVTHFYDGNPDKPGKTYSKWGGFLEQLDRFDAEFFGISPREAVHVDPQQRLLLEVAWEALEDAGENVERLAGSDTGVFIGISSHDYSDIQVKGNSTTGSGHYASTGAAGSIAANRLSYFFNFHGPSFAVDTACSSSLVAVHNACQSLWSGETDLALAGGVNCIITPEATISFSKAAMLSPDGRCKAFDASANGYVRGEGAGVIVLKPLSRAQADGDCIYAVIRASGLNQDGRTSGLTLPNRSAQEVLLRSVYRQAGIDEHDVNYVEAHGTGTAAGDPIEGNAIGTVLGNGRSPGNCLWIGSVKTNIGHLEAASGIAGLIKTALMLKHRQLPPNLHFSVPNPRIDFAGLNLRVPRALEPWPATSGPAVAGVNSFGFGGTNAHVVLAEAPPCQTSSNATPPAEKSHLLPLSARTTEALTALVSDWQARLRAASESETSLRDMCYTASVRRSHHDYRLSLAFRSCEDLCDQLDAFLHDEGRPGMVFGRAIPGRRPKVAFVFSGMGPQWWAMGRRLMEDEAVFRESIETCDRLLRRHLSWSLLEELTADEASSRMHRTEIAQPANFALQVALAAVWRSWGIEPAAIVGHSAGEVAAAHVAGALTLEDAVEVIYHRSRFQQRTSGRGRMVAVTGPLEEVQRLLGAQGGRVSIAAINSAQSITLSGDADAVQQIADEVNRAKGFARMLSVDVPYHSYHMDSLKADLTECLQSIRPSPPSIPILTTAMRDAVAAPAFDDAYWWDNVRLPVAFADAINRLIADGHDTFVELSPHPALARPIAENLLQAGVKGVVLPSLRREEDDRTVMLGTLGNLFTLGHDVDWRKLYMPPGLPSRLPGYPWQRESYWTESEASRRFRLRQQIHPLLGSRLDTAHPTWEQELDAEGLRYLHDHRVQDSTLYPAAAYVELALAVGREVFPGEAFAIERLELLKPLVLTESGSTVLQTVFDPENSFLKVHARIKDSGQAWTVHATATLVRDQNRAPVHAIDLDTLRARCATEITRIECYQEFAGRGLHYGPSFQGIQTLWAGTDQALGLVLAPVQIQEDLSAYSIHPAVLDACFQVLIGAVSPKDDEAGANDGIYVPVRIGRIRAYGACAVSGLWSYANLADHRADSVAADYQLFDTSGTLLAEVSGFECQLLAASRSLALEDLSGWLSEFQWFAKARAAAIHPAPDFLDSPSRIALELRSDIASLCENVDRDRHYREITPQIEELALAYICRAFERLGWELDPGEHVAADALMDRLGVRPEHRRSFVRMLEIAAEDGVLANKNGGWQVCRVPQFTDTDVETVRQSLLNKHPHYDAEIDLLARSGASLADVLRGDLDALQLLFPDGSLASAERFYQDSPSMHVYNAIVQRAVSRAVAPLPEDRAVRILEIGAGTGATTSHLVPVLPPNRTEYIFTDVSTAFTSAAKRKFADVPFVQYGVLDIENPPRDQGFEEHSFDLIVATDVLHATKDLRRTLAHVTELLAPEGMLVLLEATAAVRLVDLVFGLQSGWWLFSDLDLRPERPWLSPERWKSVLAESGFVDVEILSDATPEYESHQSAILARRSPSAAGRPQTAVSLRPRAPGVWLIFGDRSGIGEGVARRLQSVGQESITVSYGEAYRQIDTRRVEVDPARAADMQALVDWVDGRGVPCHGVVHLWNLDDPPTDRVDVADLEFSETLGCVAGMHLVQALSRADWTDPPHVYFVTRGAQRIAPADIVSPTCAPIWGFGRVLLNEHPQLRCTLVDLDPAGPRDDVEQLFQELWSADQEREVGFRGRSRYVNRLVPVHPTALESAKPPQQLIPRSGAFRLQVSRPGILDTITLRESSRRPPGSGEVEIQVHSSGLNFRDVMQAMGLLPAGADGEVFYGEECAGTILRVGPDVEDFRPGDDVIVLTHGSFASHVTVKTSDVFIKPPRLTFEEAATIPSAFLTAHYALHHLAKLAPAERLLIHAAAGGVGLAAVQLAQQVNAQVLATAGSPEKRDFLKAAGVAFVGDSRSLGFAEEVMRATGGEGVDVVLNSLSGEFIPKSLSTLRSGGRFLELGKVDIYRNSRLALLPFRRALSYFAIDMIQVHRERPALVRSLLLEVLQQIERGSLQPLPITTFPVSDAANAFRHMAQAKHIGKIIITLQDQNAAVASSQKESLFRADASYLITGGLGGFGLAVAQRMVSEGARNLILAGRTGASTPDAEAAVARMRRSGARVRVAKLDVADRTEVESVIAALAPMPPLRGIIHAAMVLDDGYLLQLDRARFRRVTASKMIGAWNLHVATSNCPLDFFVLFSSVASVIGAPGQANYAAANVFLEALAHYRRARNMPALVINWGPLAEVGYVARHREVGRYLSSLGLHAFTPREATSVLCHLLRSNRAQVGAIRLDFQTMAAQLPQLAETPRLSYLSQRAALDHKQSDMHGRKVDSLRNALGTATAKQKQELLESFVREQLARILATSPSKLDLERPLVQLGVDSLMAVELQTIFEHQLGVALPMGTLLGPDVTAMQLATRFLDQLHTRPDVEAAGVRARAGVPPLSAPVAVAGL